MRRIPGGRLVALVALLCLMAPRPAMARPADTFFTSSSYRIIINVPAKTLEVYWEGQLIRHCPCAVGRPWTPSPYGIYRIINKVVNPVWYIPAGGAVPAGPSNPLGPRWMGVSKPGYGIHGTNVEQSIGTAASHGCVRLSREDILWLFDAVPIGTRVDYIYSPAVVTGDPMTGFAAIEIAPDLYEYNALTPESLQNLAHAWGGRLSLGLCAALISGATAADHRITDLNPTLACAGRSYDVELSLAGRTVLLPVATVARALADAGAEIAASDLTSPDLSPSAELDDRFGLPIALSPIGHQLALLSPVVVRLDGRTLSVPGRLADGEPYVHLPTLIRILAPGGAVELQDLLTVEPDQDRTSRFGAVDRRMVVRDLPKEAYVSWREVERLFSPGIIVRRSGPWLNLFRGRD